MMLQYKDDWPQARERYDAWWHGQIVDRAAIRITAPIALGEPADGFGKAAMPPARPEGYCEEEILNWFGDPDNVIPEVERKIEATYWGGEAFPFAWPMPLVEITSAYLGCPYRIAGNSAGWPDPIIHDWDRRPKVAFDPDNRWWRVSKRLLEVAAQQGVGRYYVSIPDLCLGEMAQALRGAQRLLMDLIDRPEVLSPFLEEIGTAWLGYWEASNAVIHQWMEGYVFWMGIWSESPSTVVECDISCTISASIYEKFFLPLTEWATEQVGRTIYHLDGPGAVQHVDALVSLPKLDGIQWIPGAGRPPTSASIPMLRRIQEAGKLLVLYCEDAQEVETLLTELKPEGLLLNTTCDSVEQANALLKNVERWTARRGRIAT